MNLDLSLMVWPYPPYVQEAVILFKMSEGSGNHMGTFTQLYTFYKPLVTLAQFI